MDINIKNRRNYFGEGEYVGRPAPLKNPFYLERESDREVVIYQYGLYIKKEIEKNSSKIILELDRLISILMDKRVLNLICWCSPKLCHASIIKEILLNKIYYGSWLIDGMIGMKVNGEEI